MATVKERIAKVDADIAAQKAVRAALLKRDQKAERVKKFAESKAERAADTRKKILLGALSMKMMDESEVMRKMVNDKLDKFLDKDYDRKLFNFPIKSAEIKTGE